MQIKNIQIQAYKKFNPRIEIEFTDDFNVLVGVNGSGKSSLFEAIAYIFANVIRYCKDEKNREREFDFKIDYEFLVKNKTNESNVFIELSSSKESGNLYTLAVNGKIINSKAEMLNYMPDNLIFYYAGFSKTLGDIVRNIEKESAATLYSIKDKDFSKIPSLFSNQITYIKEIHYPVLLLMHYLKHDKVEIPLKGETFTVDRITIWIKKPEEFNNNNYEEFYKLSGFLRRYLDALISASYSGGVVLDTDTESPYFNVEYHKDLIDAIYQIGDWSNDYVEKKDSFLLFQIFNLLYEVGILNNIHVTIKNENNETTFDIYELSEGEQQLITIASIKEFLLNGNSLLLLDEPDAFLHPKRQRQLIPHLKSILGNSKTQILLASHSPFIAQAVDSENVLLFNPTKPEAKSVDKDLLSYNSIASEIFDVESDFSTDIQQLIADFKSYRTKILKDEEFDIVELKKLIEKLSNKGEEVKNIVARELSQLQRLKKFDLNG